LFDRHVPDPPDRNLPFLFDDYTVWPLEELPIVAVYSITFLANTPLLELRPRHGSYPPDSASSTGDVYYKRYRARAASVEIRFQRVGLKAQRPSQSYTGNAVASR